MKQFAAAISCMALLCACAGGPQAAPGAPSVPAGTSSSIKITALRAGIDLEQAVYTAVTAERAAKVSGLLVGANAAKADASVEKLYVLLKQLRPLIDAGVSPDLGSITALIGDVMSIAQKGY